MLLEARQGPVSRSSLTEASASATARAGQADETPARHRGAGPELIVMGEVLSAYGVRGWLKVRTFTASASSLLDYERWWLERAGDWREFVVCEARVHGAAIVARLEGFEVREDVGPWRGASIAVPRSALPALQPGEVYLSDLIGIAVVNRQETMLGKVAGLIDTGAHPVLRVVGEWKDRVERLIPLVPAYVDAIDVASRRMVVDWPADD